MVAGWGTRMISPNRGTGGRRCGTTAEPGQCSCGRTAEELRRTPGYSRVRDSADGHVDYLIHCRTPPSSVRPSFSSLHFIPHLVLHTRILWYHFAQPQVETQHQFKQCDTAAIFGYKLPPGGVGPAGATQHFPEGLNAPSLSYAVRC